MAESKPGVLEKFSYISRNAEVVIAGIAVIVGNFPIAFLSGIGAGIDHWFGEKLKKRRLKASPA